MRRTTALLHVLIGILTVAAGTLSDDVQSSTSTSVSVSTVTRKVTSRSFARSGNVTQGLTPVTEAAFAVQPTPEDGDAKPQKVKKKILASNPKNGNDKGDKQNVGKPIVNGTEAFEGGKPNSSDSAEDDLIEDAIGKSENGTTESRGSKPKGAPVEGRSLEDRSSEENVNVNAKAKTKLPPSTTERTTNAYSYETYGDFQKVLNNNYLNNEGYEQRAARPSTSVVFPIRKSTPISRENSLKNAIRFESEYYGPTGQTDWVPIIPEKLPARSPVAGAQNLGNKLRPVVVVGEKSNKTNAIVFPSDGVQPLDKVPVREQTTVRHRVASTTVAPVRHVTKFRGAVKYKPFHGNSTAGEGKFQNETVLKRSNSSVEVPAVEVPVTGASWTPSMVPGGKKPPVREETTEISVVSSTNHTTKSQNAVDGGLVVPPENVKLENVTKEQPVKEEASSTAATSSTTTPSTTTITTTTTTTTTTTPVPPPKRNESSTTETSPKLAEGATKANQTDVVVPGSLDEYQRRESTPLTLTESDSTSVDVTTEEATTTETFPELTTYLRVLNATAATPAVSEASSHSSEDKVSELPVTIALTTDDRLLTSTEEIAVNSSVTPSPEVIVIPTTLREASEDFEKSTEVEPITVQSETTSEEPFIVTQKEVPVMSNRTTTTPPVATVVSAATAATTTITTTSTTTPKPTTTTTPLTTTTSTTTEPTTTSTTTSSTAPTTSTTTTTTTTMRVPEVSEEGIYYKNYIPTTTNPHEEITEENVPAYLRLTVQAKSWEELCRLKEDLRDAIIRMLGGKNVSSESVHFLNLNERNCLEKIEETRGDSTNGTIFLPVNMFLMDKNGDFDKNLSEAFLTLWGRRGLDFELPIRKVDFVTPIVNLTELAEPPLGGSVVAAIVISCVAGICVILLGILFVIMKRRQKRFNYGQRCTPVSLDAYSLDSVSIYNSVRRKGVRASKRSYGNAAFDDPEVPTHPMNFAGLANFSADKEQLYEEFNIIPQVYPKVEELPAGAETKNRYANVIPLPETRVHLTVKDGDALSDYINANYVRGLKGAEKLYIACQAPLESTVEDFWRMVWEQQCKVILMLTDLQENGIEKCADYLPPNEVTDNLRLFGDFQVTLKKRDVKEKYIISNLKLKNMEANLWREVTHLWYLGWPEQGVPSEANSLIAFLIEARSQMKIQNGATTSSPVVVHCSPGTGRTGTVIACDLCIREYEQSRMVDIPRCVFNLRRDRAGCVQTKDQYAFIYQVLNVYATKLSGGGIESI